MVTTGGASVLCPRMFVFLRLMVRMKSLNAFETLSISGVWQQLHYQQTARPSSGLHRSLPWLWGERGWLKSMLSALMHSEIPLVAVPKARFRRTAKNILKSDGARRQPWFMLLQMLKVWRNCHWTALFPNSCQCGKPWSCFAALEGNQSWGESWKGCLNWPGQTSYHYY